MHHRNKVSHKAHGVLLNPRLLHKDSFPSLALKELYNPV